MNVIKSRNKLTTQQHTRRHDRNSSSLLFSSSFQQIHNIKYKTIQYATHTHTHTHTRKANSKYTNKQTNKQTNKHKSKSERYTQPPTPDVFHTLFSSCPLLSPFFSLFSLFLFFFLSCLVLSFFCNSLLLFYCSFVIFFLSFFCYFLFCFLFYCGLISVQYCLGFHYV